MKKSILIFSAAAAAVIGLIIWIVGGSGSSSGNAMDQGLMEGEAAVFKSANCGCCSLYVPYLKKGLGTEVKVVDVSDMDAIKSKYGVPPELQSCHTTVVGDYVIEGHMPVEAIEKLLTEKPEIKGIALPGMPSGSPGMPGPKNAPFAVYSIKMDGTYEIMMSL